MTNLLLKYSPLLEELKHKSQVDSLIIFGSYSNSKYSQLSDLDIAVIFSKNVTEEEKIEILSHSTDELDICDFWTLPLPLQFKIVSSNNILKESSNFNQIKTKITLKWLNFKPRLRKMYLQRGYNEEYVI